MAKRNRNVSAHLASLAIAILFAAVVEGLTVSTPPQFTACLPSHISWSNAQGKVYLSAIEGKDISQAPIKTFPQMDATQDGYTWNVDLPAGKVVTLQINDDAGVPNYSSQVTILPTPPGVECKNATTQSSNPTTTPPTTPTSSSASASTTSVPANTQGGNSSASASLASNSSSSASNATLNSAPLTAATPLTPANTSSSSGSSIPTPSTTTTSSTAPSTTKKPHTDGAVPLYLASPVTGSIAAVTVVMAIFHVLL
ncbi:hypothetical protein FA10DRAFT_298747 [Acaromyces ingoldii]|uniref:Ser-Thr-rich glycosyl-phosphatidyl-inositol-anchored membrane family-domain-containing protein n=1 Tax=Acaromyces ingoldii TaxID=215250 RepID=A0A316YWD1_9BASI|nr:hypothetical protein FA10DRAFT_298747 [Acaromyces ingoldii]PWN93346.1 hypothetical protein FA10DRAFT_298747 [Acaromyces ingoldii]